MMTSKPPTESACREMMRAARGAIRENSFFISRETGEILGKAWRDKNSYFPNIPNDRYEIHILHNAFLSYDELAEQLTYEMDRIWEEDQLIEDQKKQNKCLAKHSDERLKMEYGLSNAQIRAIREGSE